VSSLSAALEHGPEAACREGERQVMKGATKGSSHTAELRGGLVMWRLADKVGLHGNSRERTHV
jgi:hypothetical protein